jgi:molybdopterin converting factor small subunit
MLFVPTSHALENMSFLRGDNVQDPDFISVTVRIPVALRERTGNQRQVHATGRTVREVIDSLEHEHPGIRFNLCYETGELRPYVNVFLGQENVRFMDGLDTPVPAGSMLHIIHSVAGG